MQLYLNGTEEAFYFDANFSGSDFLSPLVPELSLLTGIPCRKLAWGSNGLPKWKVNFVGKYLRCSGEAKLFCTTCEKNTKFKLQKVNKKRKTKSTIVHFLRWCFVVQRWCVFAGLFLALLWSMFIHYNFHFISH